MRFLSAKDSADARFIVHVISCMERLYLIVTIEPGLSEPTSRPMMLSLVAFVPSTYAPPGAGGAPVSWEGGRGQDAGRWHEGHAQVARV